MRPIHARRPAATQPRLVYAAFAVAATLMLAACGGNEPFAPDAGAAADASSVAADASGQGPAAESFIGGLTTSPRIVFASYRIGGHADIYRMDPSGSNVVRLTSFSGDEAGAAVSWDHKRLAFVRRRVDANNVGRDDIYLVNMDGTGKRWAVPAPSTFTILDPSWSPDGKRLVVSVIVQGVRMLATLDVATGALSLVTGWNAVMQGQQPSYHPDGKSIIFVDETGRMVRRVFPGADDGTLVNLNVSVGHPTFSPDGKQFAYERGIAGTSNSEIFVQNLATSASKRITYSSSYDGWPTWSPDGTKLAFESLRSGQFQIWVASAAGGTATRLTHTSTGEVGPSWSH